MQIGMLVIGTELLQGKQLEANIHWLGQFLRPFHRQIHEAIIVDDQIPAIHKALEKLYTSCELVIISGGLGPTPDDVTKEAIASFFQKPISFSSEAHEVATKNYKNFHRPLPDNHTYSTLPQDFVALENSQGFAPGLWFHGNCKMLLCVAGVPREFQALISDHLPKLVGDQIYAQEKLNLINIRTKGIAEEKIFGELCPDLWRELQAFGEVSSLPQTLSVDIGVKTQKPEKEIKDFIMATELAPFIWGFGFETIEEAIINTAREKKLTIGFAESCTGGLCSHRLTNIAGSSDVFFGSIISYDNSVKKALLNVNDETLKNFGAVSAECALEMVRGARTALLVDAAVALTGIAGPGGGSPEKPVGTVWLGVSVGNKIYTKKFELRGDRENLKIRFSQVALFELLDCLKAI